MNEVSQTLTQPGAAQANWFEFAKRHRSLLASLFVLVFPLIMPFTALAVNILIYGLYALGFNLLFGYLGLLSFGHAALFGTGAYLCGIAIVHFALPWYAAIAIGVVGGALMAAAIGVLAIRTRGIYFAMVTMALSQCVYYLFYQAVDWTGGENGLRGINVREINIFGLKFDFIDPMTRYYVVAAFVILAFFVLSRILASPFGAVIEAVRENEARARASGYNVMLTRLGHVHSVGRVLRSRRCAGCVASLHRSDRDHALRDLGHGRDDVTVGWHGNVLRSVRRRGSVFLLLENLVSLWTVHWQLIVGAIFVICVLFFPAGIWGTILKRMKQ